MSSLVGVGTTADRVAGGLWGVCVGDALGAPCEGLTPNLIAEFYGRLTWMEGGGIFDRKAGEPTDDTDMTLAVARAYADGYSLDKVANNFLGWYRSGPGDIGTTTKLAIRDLADGVPPTESGRTDDLSAGNGGLMRAVPIGLARPDGDMRRREAAEICRVTHADRRCVGASVAYCNLVNLLVAGVDPDAAVDGVAAGTDIGEDVRQVLLDAWRQQPERLDTSGYVLATLGVAVWALLSRKPFKEALVTVVNLGGDADTTGAVAGGLLGAHQGFGAIPERWTHALGAGPAIDQLWPALLDLRQDSRPTASTKGT